jgi:hypothetical protein
MKVITISEFEGIPEGSVFDAEPRIVGGVACYSGTWACMAGSMHIDVPVDHCEIWTEEKHDLVAWAFKQLPKLNELDKLIAVARECGATTEEGKRGATTEEGKRVTTESTVCFTSAEFAEFSKRLTRLKR